MTRTVPRLDTFTRAYIECALWSSIDDDGEPLDTNYSLRDIDADTLAKMIRDCEAFQRENWDAIDTDLESAGHDFWLTRNGHGAGFWDGDWSEHGDELTERAKEYREYHLYVGDDGEIYGHQCI